MNLKHIIFVNIRQQCILMNFTIFSEFLVRTNIFDEQNQSRGWSKKYTKAGARMEEEWNEDKDVFGTSILEIYNATKSYIQGYSLQGRYNNSVWY